MKSVYLPRMKASAANAAAKSSGAGRTSGKLVNPYLLVLAVVVSGIFGVIALQLRVNETEASKDFANSPSYAIWVVFVSGVLMIATFLSSLAWLDFSEHGVSLAEQLAMAQLPPVL